MLDNQKLHLQIRRRLDSLVVPQPGGGFMIRPVDYLDKCYRNRWKIRTTTVIDSDIARKTVGLIEKLWTQRQSSVRASSQTASKQRKAIGFSILESPSGETLTA